MKKWLTSLVVFSGILFGGLWTYGMMISAYESEGYVILGNTSNETAFNLNTTTWIKDKMGSIQNKTLKIGERGLVNLWSIYDSVTIVFDMAEIFFGMPNLVSAVINQVTYQNLGFAIPAWFINMILTIIVIFFTLKVLAIITKRGEV